MFINDILQPTHLLFILVVALLFLGPKRLPEAGRALGKGIRDFRSAIGGDEDRSAAVPTETSMPTAVPTETSMPTPPPAVAVAPSAEPATHAPVQETTAPETTQAESVHPVG